MYFKNISFDPTKNWPRHVHECPGGSGRCMGHQWPAAGLEARTAAMLCTGPFEGGPHYLHYLHHSLVSGQTTGREHSPTHQQKMDYRSNQSILKEISPEYSLEGLMLKLKLQYFGHLMWRTDSLKRPWCWEIWRQEEEGTREAEMVVWHHWLNGHDFEQAPGVGDGQGSLVCCSPRGRKELDTTEWLNWIDRLSLKENLLVYDFWTLAVAPTSHWKTSE